MRNCKSCHGKATGAVEGLCAEPPAQGRVENSFQGEILQADFMSWGSEQHWGWDGPLISLLCLLKSVWVTTSPFWRQGDGCGEKRQKRKGNGEKGKG